MILQTTRRYSIDLLKNHFRHKLSLPTTDIIISSNFFTTETVSSNVTGNTNRYNEKLESIKQQGQPILNATISDIQSKTNRHLLIEDEDKGPTHYQLKEAARLKRLVEDAVEYYTARKGSTFCIMNEPIAIVDVEITEDLRQARVFWTLPYVLLLMGDSELSSMCNPRGRRSSGIGSNGMEIRQHLVSRMQDILNQKGGVLQGYVHGRLRRYYRPPIMKFVTAEGEMLRRFLHELL